MITATPLVQDPRPTLVGERVNSQGSRKAKELLLTDDYDGLVQIAEDQVGGGAHVLDLCVALTERSDEADQMAEVAKRVSLTQPAPIQVDSTEPDVIERALEQIPGRAIVNPNHITPYPEIPENERELADDLVFNRREDALERFIAHFESKGEDAAEEAGDPTEGMEPEEALHWHILRRRKEGVEEW